MTDFVVPTGNTEGVKIRSNGKVYYPDKHGTLRVDSPSDAAEIKNSDAKHKFDMIKEKSYTFGKDQDSNRCTKCLFAAFDFSKKCPRCGNQLKETI